MCHLMNAVPHTKNILELYSNYILLFKANEMTSFFGRPLKRKTNLDAYAIEGDNKQQSETRKRLN